MNKKHLYGEKGKRAIDLTLALVMTILLGPLMALCWICIKCTSTGPAIYRQERIGKRGRKFYIMKFRSMYFHRPEGSHDARATQISGTGILLKMKNDPRITPFGRMIRRTSIDELPQLFNVIAGEMSLVGPRPLIPFMAREIDLASDARFSVLPGMTGYWQIYAREKNTSLEEMLCYDQRYIQEISLLIDMKVLLRTIPAVFSGRGAF
jgi:lipopolysaccharide/colanic/teichoic acid biosynthesis glycosyltransferase